MKRMFSLMLAVMMLMTLAMPAFADEPETGSITINGVSADVTYEVYRLLDLESYNVASGAYSYKVNSVWTGFFETADAKTYISIDDAGYVSWVAAEDDDTKAAFAKMVLSYAQTNDISPVRSSKNSGEFVITENSGKFSDLELGYYLVDSTMGALCGLTTTNPNASINAKNGSPTIDKQVQEDSLVDTATQGWGASNTADIGQIVNYQVTINVHAGAQNYVLHDVMADGLTFIKVTRIEHVIPGSQTHEIDAGKYEVKTGTSVITDGCDFEVHFSEEFCNELETNNKVIVYYTAMLNRNAVIAGTGNINTTWLSYGEGHETEKDTTATFTFGIDIVKTDSQNTLIDGAKFKIYDAETGGNEVLVVLMDDGVTYRRARADETGIDIVVAGGQVRVVGFDNGTYYLEETEAPDGYNKLTARQKFIISDGNLDATFNGATYSTGSGVHVVNKTGSMLPETGGLGTTLFIVFGGLACLGAGVVLFAKKRLAQMEE